MSTGWMPADEATGGPATLLVPLDDASRIGEARRTAETLAFAAGLGETERGTLAIVVTEMATNLARHARGGRVLLSTVGLPGAAGIEVVAIDTGPGIANVGRAFEDGFSSAGTAGKGLSAIRRMAGDFDLFSRAGPGAGCGTALVARVWSAAGERAVLQRADAAVAFGVVCVPLAGEQACGDAWLVHEERDRTLVVVVDGLGHGPEAATAADAAIRQVRQATDASPADLLDMCHLALRPTRGAAMAVAAVDHRRRVLAFAGIGNIAASVLAPDGASRSLASHNGTLGHAVRRVQPFEQPWAEGATLVMHSDGVNTRWRADAYPGLLYRDPTLLAAVLFRDAARGRDDATVLALRERAE